MRSSSSNNRTERCDRYSSMAQVISACRSNSCARSCTGRDLCGPVAKLQPLVEMTRLVNAMFDAFNSRQKVGHPENYKRRVTIDDLSSTAADNPLVAILRWFADWEAETRKRPLEPADQRRCFISHDKCWYDMQLCLQGTLDLRELYLRLSEYRG